MTESFLGLSFDDRGERVGKLQASLIRLGYEIPTHEVGKQFFGEGTRDALKAFQHKSGVRVIGRVDKRTDANLARAVAAAEDGLHVIEGRILFENGVPAGEITLECWTRAIGIEPRKEKAAATDLSSRKEVGETKTDKRGFYFFSYDPNDPKLPVNNIEVATKGSDGKEISLSKPKYDLARHEVLNLVAPSSLQKLELECDRLFADLEKAIGDSKKLANAQEDDERRDLTLLHQATGWDARLIALAAIAEKRSAETKIPAKFLYALFRVGLPSDKHLLCQIRDQAIKQAIARANDSGIVKLNDTALKTAMGAFTKFKLITRGETRAPGALSTFRERLDKLALDGNQSNLFEELYFSHRGEPAALWAKAAAAGIGGPSIEKLRLQGKLDILTHNNAALTGDLLADIGSPDKLDRLVELDLFRADKWKERIKAIAGTNDEALAEVIPPLYLGEKVEDRLEGYAADLARKVRRSYPTQVIAHLVESDELPLGGADPATKGSVVSFLKRATARGFRLGSMPVKDFVARHGDVLFENENDESIEVTIQNVRRMHRLYQITPSDGALKAVDELGFSYADDIVKYPFREFCEHFGGRFPSRREVELTWRKAQQVNAVSLNYCIAAMQAYRSTSPYAIAGDKAKLIQAQSHLRDQLKDHPTMESLFGSLDFCECEHCRSVLSPAAYLVDLFQFLDPEDDQWTHKCEAWIERHNDEAYPYRKPFDVLIGGFLHLNPDLRLPFRRPDLQHLSLTCENTHTALPYIDVVNEILEYSVAEGALPQASYDTGEATTEELLAEPQHILPAAYEVLRDPNQACHPLTLPFDLWLETVRGFLEHFETPFWKVLEVFRRNEPLFSALHRPCDGAGYFRAAVFYEYLGISPVEFDVFTRQRPVSWHGLYGNVEGDLSTALKNAKTLARQLDVSYKQLADIVQTQFVNPELESFVPVWKYGFGPSDMLWYLEHRDDPDAEEFEKRIRTRLAEALSTSEVDEQLTNILEYLEELRDEGRFERVLVLRDETGLCNFHETYLEYARPAGSTPSDLAFTFVKINLFVRLWKKLGWTIEETDRALRAFQPSDLEVIVETNIDEFFRTALVYLAHLKELDEKLEAGRDSRLKLLTLWTDLPTTGRNPLYAKIFLTPGVQKIDPIFDDPLGNYLRYFNANSGNGGYEDFYWHPEEAEDKASGNVPLSSHLLGIQSALLLTADEVGLILADAGGDLATAALNLPNCSLLYRYRLLAASLQLSVRDLIALKAMSGLDPFTALSSLPLEELQDDYPLTQTLEFVEIAQTVKDSGFRIEDLAHLLDHSLLDSEGKYRDDPTLVLSLLKSLASELHRIGEEHAVPPDPATFSDDQLRQALSLALPPKVAEIFFAMWSGTVEYQAVQTDVLPEQQLDPERFADEDAIRVSYDDFKSEQRLIYRGVLLHDERVRLEDRSSWIATDSFWSTRFGGLLDSVQQDARRFFDEHLLKTDLGDRHSFGFLEAQDFELLFSTDGDDSEKRERLAHTFLPFLQRQLARQIIVQTLAATLGADPALTEALLTDVRLLRDPSQPDERRPLLEAFEAAAERGVTVTYATTQNPTTEHTIWSPTADTAFLDPESGEQLDHALFEGYLEVPTTGAYRFYVACKQLDVQAVLRFAHLPDPLLRGVTTGDEDPEYGLKSQVVELKAGTPYGFTCAVRNLGGSTMALLVQGETLTKGALSRLTLYPRAAVDRLDRARILLSKVWQIVRGFGLSEREVRYLLTHREDFNDLDLSGLPTRASDPTATEPTTLLSQFLRLANYGGLRADLQAGDELIDVFEHARREYDETAETEDEIEATGEEVDLELRRVLAHITRWAEATGDDIGLASRLLLAHITRLLAHITRREPPAVFEAMAYLGFCAVDQDEDDPDLWVANAFVDERGVRRLWKILQIVGRLGVSVRDVTRWVTWNDDEPNARTARDLKQTVKAHYEQENWLRIARPIHDLLRRKQRNALVAFVMHRDDFESIERLYEFYLVDPGMEPVVLTSRIQLAISSVQQFIQRCLLNLEPKVAPSMIDAKQWEWMKRYRVWEANRKIFLYPENWLEPEWRDDKTFLFRELESKLLQGDVSRDLVEDAFHAYLKGLETIARLDIVTLYREEDQNDPSSYTLHVIGRTFDTSPKYFYRRYRGGMWTPWEPVSANIEGDHVVAVVWRRRLHLFWVTFMEKGEMGGVQAEQPLTGDGLGGASIDDVVDDAHGYSRRVVECQLNWSEYFQGKWTPRESGSLDVVVQATVEDGFNESGVFIHVTKEYDPDSGADSAVNIHLSSPRLKRLVCGTGALNGGAPQEECYLSPNTETAFRIVSKNSPPRIEERETPGEIPYKSTGNNATRYMDEGNFELTFESRLLDADGKIVSVMLEDREILAEGDPAFSLLLPSNLSDTTFSPTDRHLSDFFYQDRLNTFFVEPILTEPPIEQPEAYGLGVNAYVGSKDIPVHSGNAEEPPYQPEPIPPTLSHPYARHALLVWNDWATDPATAIEFEGYLVGANGSLGIPATVAGPSGRGDGGSTRYPSGSGLAARENFATVHGLTVVTGSGVHSGIVTNRRGRRFSNETPR